MTDLVSGPPTERSRGEATQADLKHSTRGISRIQRLTSRRWVLPLAEGVVSITAGIGFMLLSMHISVNPLNRIGQVSGLAKVQQYVAVVGLPVLAVLLFVAYRGTLRNYRTVQRLACAAIAGLATGVVAGGIAVALHGTPWGLGGQEGDPGNLMGMANDMMRGEGLPGVYPPGFPALLALWAELFHGGVAGVGHALKDLQLLLSALVGPMAYLSWRMMLRPFWAMAIAVPTSITFLDPIRPYSHGAMLVLLPLLAACFRELRRAGELSTRSALLRGVGFGVAFGAMFIWYSGWYLWAAPGAFLLAALLFPWRRGRLAVKRALVFLGGMLVTAAVIGAPLLYQLVRLGATTVDRYAYINTYIDPAYVMSWASDRPGPLTYHDWPASGELAGQSGFVVVLLLGVGLGVGLGLRNVVVRTAGFVLVGAWLLRFWFASHMAHNQAVQLYPRTTWIILYCLIILAVLGVKLSYERGAGRFRSAFEAVNPAKAVTLISPRTSAQLATGLICVIALFGTMGASWSANRYMPSANPKVEDMGLDAYRAHLQQLDNGECPKYSPYKGKQGCNPINMELSEYTFVPDQPHLWCANTEDQWAVCGRKG
ncbi:MULTISPECIES: hypothetical protein [unclassified Kitasatospora]|uniref:hypothetical protein n=1 Tax=unclassified Kitasatospora TaxID=2633591 RepID=UPI00070928F6|nr:MULTISPECIES: hypothetical protein [unclassified Kitasatospora]KQV18484.1 hypothetical protein ASC99_04435 [Kitasatospora sp. Root107]KRB74469.1 hypothetical protein ASE03_18355 [Kitasatospora sp. Root187]